MRRATAILAMVLAGVVLVSACSHARSDDAITNEIKAKMFSDPQLKDSNLQVSVDHGVATISGEVSSDAARSAAFSLASATSGVSKVNDQMTVAIAQAQPAMPNSEPQPAPQSAPAKKVRHRPHAAAAVSEPEPQPAQTPAPASEPAPVPEPMAQPAPPPPPPPPPQPRTVEFPAGTIVTVRMIDSVDSAVNRTGQIFHASLDAPLVLDNEVIVPQGADVYVRLVQASSAGRMAGKSELRLELVKLAFQGRSFPLVSSTYDVAGTSRGKRTAATIGVGSAIGAAIGAIAGGGKGAAIGAGVGAGSGAVYQGATHGKQVRIPSETRLDFRLEQPAPVTYLPGKIRGSPSGN